MRKTGMMVAVLVAASVAGAGMASACSKPAKAAAIEAGLIDWINGERAKKGLSGLSPSAALDKAAEGHACDMAKKGYFSHTDKKGRKAKARIKAAGYRPGHFVENLGLSTKASVGEMAGAWRDSGAHWKNVLNRSITDIGMAVATDGRNVYYVFVGANPG